METKRCPYCHKLQRADAQVCSRCGHVYVRKRARPSMREWTQPSIPPASAHRAGHYSGLHPEDQPYQSSKIAVRRPTTQNIERSMLPEPEHIILPDPVSDPIIRRRVNIPERYDEFSAEKLPTIREPSSYGSRKWLLPRRVILILLAISCLFFLLANSIFAFILIKKFTSTAIPTVIASPTELRANDTVTLNGSGFSVHSLVVFTYDGGRPLFDGNKHPLEALTNGQGTFSVQLRIPGDWEAGPHFLHATDASAQMSVSATVTVSIG